MAASSLTKHPPKGILRWALRLPRVLYRIGLGGLLGQRFILLNHIGRKTGTVHQTVVEVVGHDQDSDTYYVVSGWGFKAQWYQNIIAQPDIIVQVGRRKLSVHAEPLPPEEAVRLIRAYQARYPVAARELGRVMDIDMGSTDDARLQQIIRDRLPMLGLRLQPPKQ